MARIRSIKPEFWSSPGIEATDPYSRLLYIAMWNWADDSGVGVANPRELLGFAFPLDDEITVADLRRMLVEIRRVFGVNFYTVAGRQYYSIPSWEKHQKFDRRSKGKYPGPEEADAPEIPANKGEGADSTESHESPPSIRRDSVAGTGEQGNRGTGEQGKTTPSKPPALTPRQSPSMFDQFWEWYPRKVGKEAARKAWDKARTKTDQQNIIDGIERYRLDPNLPGKEFIPHPATWLNEGRWDDEPLPVRGQQQRPNAAQSRLQAGYDLLQETRAETAGQLELGA